MQQANLQSDRKTKKDLNDLNDFSGSKHRTAKRPQAFVMGSREPWQARVTVVWIAGITSDGSLINVMSSKCVSAIACYQEIHV
jgi:hypothetical protein